MNLLKRQNLNLKNSKIKMPSTYKRSLVKGIIWEGFSFVITLVAVFLVYNNFMLSLKFSLGLSLIKVILFFIHERVWKNVRWGKY